MTTEISVMYGSEKVKSLRFVKELVLIIRLKGLVMEVKRFMFNFPAGVQ